MGTLVLGIKLHYTKKHDLYIHVALSYHAAGITFHLSFLSALCQYVLMILYLQYHCVSLHVQTVQYCMDAHTRYTANPTWRPYCMQLIKPIFGPKTSNHKMLKYNLYKLLSIAIKNLGHNLLTTAWIWLKCSF